MQIDRSSKVPVYRQIYDDLHDRIQKGEYSLGSMLPSENKLCAMYGVERATVRRALALMVEDGKVAKMPGLGTSVLAQSPAAGKALETGKVHTILFLLPRGDRDIDRIVEPFYAKLINKVEHECANRGHNLLYKSFFKNDTAQDILSTCNPRGVFFATTLPLEIYRDFHKMGVPAVLVNQNHPIFPSVCLDNRAGARMAVEYLLSLGHRRIGFICGSCGDQSEDSRYHGYKATLEANGIALRPQWIAQGDWSMESGQSAMRQLLQSGDIPTAIFAANDAMAIGAISATLDAGLSVPGDISFVGFDNIDQAAFVRPSLSTVAVNYDAMSDAACMLLFEMIENAGREINVNIYVPLQFVERESACKSTIIDE